MSAFVGATEVATDASRDFRRSYNALPENLAMLAAEAAPTGASA